ncbi:SDR family oxidoreductase [Parasphingorhabdus halotolerans]|uniref:SDR family oxidoreductase n=2 Tax=Parasphingorhabdus halotolerans TaxID=2725558 RepID=A0A6H2DRW2_9SPHN|nr:SDR family oxidoreductase [Parasphingorhabdus halotolerans]
MVFGATGGIGKVVAHEFAKAGTSVAIMWRSKKDDAEALARDIEATGQRGSTHRCDVTDPVALKSAISDAIAEHGRVHTMVWAAGPLVEQVLISETTREQWYNAINTEVHGFFEASTGLISHMKEMGGGSFVHLGSAGELRYPERDMLSVTPKAANESLIRGIAREEGRHNIRANSVLVGVIEAGMFLELTKQGVFGEHWVEEVQKGLALKRWGQPEEIANAAIFLASNKASYITGQQISVAGGYGI